MMKKSVQKKRNPLTKAQNVLLRDSLRKLLGQGLIQEPEKKPSEVKQMILKNALNAIVLDN